MHNSCMTYYWCISSFLASTEVSVHLSETIVRGQVEVSARLQAGKFRLTGLSGILQNGIKDSMLFHHPGEWFGCGIGAFSNMCWQLSWTRCMLSILGIHCSDLWDQSSKLIGCWWGSRRSVFKVCVVIIRGISSVMWSMWGHCCIYGAILVSSKCSITKQAYPVVKQSKL